MLSVLPEFPTSLRTTFVAWLCGFNSYFLWRVEEVRLTFKTKLSKIDWVEAVKLVSEDNLNEINKTKKKLSGVVGRWAKKKESETKRLTSETILYLTAFSFVLNCTLIPMLAKKSIFWWFFLRKIVDLRTHKKFKSPRKSGFFGQNGYQDTVEGQRKKLWDKE